MGLRESVRIVVKPTPFGLTETIIFNNKGLFILPR